MMKKRTIQYSIFVILNILFSCKQQKETLVKNANYQEVGYIEIPHQKGTYRLKFYSDQIIETNFIPEGEEFIEDSHAVVMDKLSKESVLIETDSTLIYRNNDLEARISKDPFQLAYYYKDSLIISEKNGYTQTDSTEVLDFHLTEEEVIYGGGARVLGMNRRGNRLQLYNRAHYGYEKKAELMNYTLPLIMSSKKYAIHFDNPQIGFLDIDSKVDNTLAYETTGGKKTYQVVVGENWEDLIGQYTDLTGKQPLPPRWAFGNFASRFGYHSQKEVLQTIQKFREEEIPVDAVILDIFWFGKDIKGHMGNFEFEKDSFPEPKKMIQDLAEQNVKTILITEPFVLSTSKKWEEAVAEKVLGKDSLGHPYRFDFYFGNTGIIDIYDQKGKKWFWDIYKKYTKDYDVAGWWGDLGEPEMHPSDLLHANGTADEVHNVYGHDWARLVYEGYQKDFPNQRPFILMRSGYSGSQRFGMIPWSGDVNRSWGGLFGQTEIALSMGMQGLGYMHSDLGGFAGGEVFDSELYIRWLQYGVFQPIFRPHAQEHIPSEPVFHDTKTKKLAREAINLRYQLLPYTYTLAFENNQTGMPFMRPLFFEEPINSSKDILTNTDSYLWGSNFLISPVITPGLESKNIIFPDGIVWFDFYTNERIVGKGTKHQVKVYENYIPTFVKAGSFIPMTKVYHSTDLFTSQQLDIHYYHDRSVTKSKGKMYHDDGKTPKAYEKGQYEMLLFTATNKTDGLEVLFTAKIGNSFSATDRNLQLIVHNLEAKPSKVLLNDRVYTAFNYSSISGLLFIRFDWKASTDISIQILK